MELIFENMDRQIFWLTGFLHRSNQIPVPNDITVNVNTAYKEPAGTWDLASYFKDIFNVMEVQFIHQ